MTVGERQGIAAASIFIVNHLFDYEEGIRMRKWSKTGALISLLCFFSMAAHLQLQQLLAQLAHGGGWSWVKHSKTQKNTKQTFPHSAPRCHEHAAASWVDKDAGKRGQKRKRESDNAAPRAITRDAS